MNWWFQTKIVVTTYQCLRKVNQYVTYESRRHCLVLFNMDNWQKVDTVTGVSSHTARNADTSSADSQVDISSIFVNCKVNENPAEIEESDINQYQREELFKYDMLRGCNKKLAVTVKLTSNGDGGEEYIPIEHVSGGSGQCRIRLLDPYVLRIRRDMPMEAYKLQYIDTVKVMIAAPENTGEIWAVNKRGEGIISEENTLNRNHRSAFESHDYHMKFVKLDHDNPGHQSYSVRLNETNQHARNVETARHYDTRATYARRNRRHEYNVVVEDTTNDPLWSINNANVKFSQGSYNKSLNDLDISKISYSDIRSKPKKTSNNVKIDKHNPIKLFTSIEPVTDTDVQSNGFITKSVDKDEYILFKTKEVNEMAGDFDVGSDKNVGIMKEDIMYAVYKIGNPVLWHSLQLHLLQKYTDEDGNNIWRDVTSEEVVNVGTSIPEYVSNDVAVRYRTTDLLNKTRFRLKRNDLSLLKKTHDVSYDESSQEASGSDFNFIVVPSEDIISHYNKETGKSQGTEFNDGLSGDFTTEIKRYRRVVVRVNRAISGDKMSMSTLVRDGDSYLTLPHKSSIPIELDVEARADGNELVRVGGSGRISTVVADSTRRTRTILSLHVTNTGLAAAFFRAAVRDCGPQLTSLTDDKGDMVTTEPEVLAPRHTKRMVMEIPVELPSEISHCIVALVNKNGESVAVRDVAVKKSDRCFCVWHCNCVCLGDDPNLMCSEMSPAKLAAAGIATSDRPRKERSVCYPGSTITDIFVLFFGILGFLLIIGLMKAFIGICVPGVGLYGLDNLVKLPRPIDHYYEPWLCMRKVIRDSEGWPLHPDTKQRTVRVLSLPMEFALNAVLFIMMPSLLIRDMIKQLICTCKMKMFKDCWSKNKDKYEKMGSNNSIEKKESIIKDKKKKDKTETSSLCDEDCPKNRKVCQDEIGENTEKLDKKLRKEREKALRKLKNEKKLQEKMLKKKAEQEKKLNKNKPVVHKARSLTLPWMIYQPVLRDWMSPEAEELSKEICKDTIFQSPEIKCSCTQEVDADTSYVLTQIQKSQESICKNKKILEEIQKGLKKKC